MFKKILGSISIAFVGLTGLGMYLNNMDYWLAYDIAVMGLLVVLGIKLLKDD